MIKQFKLLKQIEPNNSIKVWDTFEIYDDYVKLDELWKLHYTRFVTHWYIEEVKDTHFGNWMVEPKNDICYLVATQYSHWYDNRIEQITSRTNSWSLFSTKEQAEQFDKMMMTVWKIWKWKKENDDCEIQDECIELSYSLPRSAFEQVFVWCNWYSYGFFLPKFSSDKKVIQLISDLWKELNNLLCWIK